MSKKTPSLKDLLTTYHQLIKAPKSKNMLKYVQRAKEEFYKSIYQVFERYAIDPKDESVDVDDCVPNLIEELIQYYCEIEEYEKCDYLMKYKSKYIVSSIKSNND